MSQATISIPEDKLSEWLQRVDTFRGTFNDVSMREAWRIMDLGHRIIRGLPDASLDVAVVHANIELVLTHARITYNVARLVPHPNGIFYTNAMVLAYLMSQYSSTWPATLK